MELAQKYVYNVWKYRSFSKAAKALYVSQPSLSVTVAKLEGELGFQIFNRSVHPITTTDKGRIYMDYLLKIYEEEKVLRRQLAATDDIEQGRMAVGGYCYLGYHVFAAVCREFKHNHPDFSLSFYDTEDITEKLRTKWIDLQVTYDSSHMEFIVIPIHVERLYVAIHKDHPAVGLLSDYVLTAEEVLSGSFPFEKEVTDFTLLTHVPFVKSTIPFDADRRLSMILKEPMAGNYTLAHASSTILRYFMVQQELGATFISDFYIRQMPHDRDQLRYFALHSPYSYRTVYLRHRKDADNQRALDEFVKIAREYCRSVSIPYPHREEVSD